MKKKVDKKKRRAQIEEIFAGSEVLIVLEHMENKIDVSIEAQQDTNRRMDRMEKCMANMQLNIEDTKVHMIVLQSDVKDIKKELKSKSDRTDCRVVERQVRELKHVRA